MWNTLLLQLLSGPRLPEILGFPFADQAYFFKIKKSCSAGPREKRKIKRKQVLYNVNMNVQLTQSYHLKAMNNLRREAMSLKSINQSIKFIWYIDGTIIDTAGYESTWLRRGTPYSPETEKWILTIGCKFMSYSGYLFWRDFIPNQVGVFLPLDILGLANRSLCGYVCECVCLYVYVPLCMCERVCANMSTHSCLNSYAHTIYFCLLLVGWVSKLVALWPLKEFNYC